MVISETPIESHAVHRDRLIEHARRNAPRRRQAAGLREDLGRGGGRPEVIADRRGWPYTLHSDGRLALPYLLSQRSDESRRATALLDYLEGYPSAEAMSHGIKDHELFGLGKAIGDKACHLFAKWMVSTFSLARIKEPSWGEYSYEVPFDSNAGRVLWRTGYLLALSDIGAYRKAQVAQPNAGKGGTEYIRVTNLRGMGVSAQVDEEVRDAYKVLCVDHLRSHKNAPQKVEIQRFQHPILYLNKERASDFDDGLIEIGRNYCYNHENPDCAACPINQHCQGYQSDERLITEYRT